MRGTSAGWACILLSAALVREADGPELRDAERKAPKEPAYASERPLYGLLVFGPKAQARVWMVLDRSKPDAGPYDILYVDLDADGDLTEPGERLVGQVGGDEARFRLPGLKDPATGIAHTDFTARASGGSDPTVMVGLMWRGVRIVRVDLPEGSRYRSLATDIDVELVKSVEQR
jgi:hypothetical protein